MHLVNALVGCLFVVFAVLHMSGPDPVFWMTAFGVGALLAFITVKSELGLRLSRVLAVATTIAMFFYFAQFFMLAPELSHVWHQDADWLAGGAIHALALLLGAFAMILVLADYSCRSKADCRESRIRRCSAFFSVPQKLENQSNPIR
ncbi:MAG: hypothetical protein O3A63_20595 [Proteobacteria bacterium]|nr:hypothetical protein [Pseudomonadota bacterium]